MTHAHWNRLGAISPGGTVIAGALDHAGMLLIATPAGIFRCESEAWLPLPNQPSIPFLQTLITSGKSLWMGGADAILFSADNGGSWKRGQTSALEHPVTCLAAAPNFANNRVVLAGTDGAGVLRSTDGGRIWQYASFGLHDFSITAMAAAPCWDDREVVFAATPSGLYRSPNGGRAWKAANVGLEGCTVLSLALSPNYASDGIVFAGTETHGIYRSSDGGFTWLPYALTEAVDTAINVVWWLPSSEILLAGTDDGQIWRSSDVGATWTLCKEFSTSVLGFFCDSQHIYAGTVDAGLFYSQDGGSTWNADLSLSARQFTSLISAGDNELFAASPTDGLWRTRDAGLSWQNVGDFESLLMTASISDDQQHTRFVATVDGLFRADDFHPDWEMALPVPDLTTIFASKAFAQKRRVWAGTWSGNYYISEDGGEWQIHPSPPIGAAVVKLGQALPDQLVSVTFMPEARTLTLWRFMDGRWQIWLESPDDAPIAQIAEAPAATDEAVVSLGIRCWRWASGRWHCILKAEKPILRLCWHPRGGLLALTADRLMHSPDFANWTVLHQSQGASLNDLALVPQTEQETAAYLLTRGGVLLQGLLSM